MQGENINILKNGIRILKPSEFKKLIDAIPKVEHKDKLEALLFTGCRYTELQWLYENPSAFSDGIIRMPSMKTASRHKERYIRLNNNGNQFVFSIMMESSEYNSSEICLLDLDGNNFIKLTENNYWDLYPTWSPDY